MSLVTIEEPAKEGFALFAFPFRPFFLLGGIYGALTVAAWAALLFARLPLPLGVGPSRWHAHELLFGLIPAIVAGFLLTAMCAWTGARPLAGRRLAALVSLWLAGRVAMWISGHLPWALVAAIDLAFLPVVASYAGRVLIRHGDRRNLKLVGLLTALTLANLAHHLGFGGVWGRGLWLGELLALDLMALVMVIVGGRITPAFTANWLRLNGGEPEQVRRSPPLDAAVGGAGFALVVADLTPWPAFATGAALLVASLNTWRLLRWRGWLARAEPMLWILHLGMLWIALAYLLRGLTPILDLSPFAWIHALGAGAMGTLIIGVMTRVSLGHTGRPLRLPRGVTWAYWAILAAGGLRLLSALGLLQHQAWLIAAAVAWALAFALFVVRYVGVLCSPRADGRPG